MKKSFYQQQRDELDGVQYVNEDREREGKKKNEKKSQLGEASKSFLQRFNERQAKGSIENTALKTLADVAGVGIGTAISAASGKFAPLIGALVIGTGHYLGDESGLLRIVGASTLSHGIAKATEYRQNDTTFKDRMSGLKDDLLHATLLKHYEAASKPIEGVPTGVPVTQTSEGTEERELSFEADGVTPKYSEPGSLVKNNWSSELDQEDQQRKQQFEQSQKGRLDMSYLDMFENQLANEGKKFQSENPQFSAEALDSDSSYFDQEDFPENDTWESDEYDFKKTASVSDPFDDDAVDFTLF
jgi:hypothetical protein